MYSFDHTLRRVSLPDIRSLIIGAHCQLKAVDHMAQAMIIREQVQLRHVPNSKVHE